MNLPVNPDDGLNPDLPVGEQGIGDWRERLFKQDPVSACDSQELDAAVDRLFHRWEAIVERETQQRVAVTDPGSSSVSAGTGFRWGYVIATAALFSGLMLASSMLFQWLSPSASLQVDRNEVAEESVGEEGIAKDTLVNETDAARQSQRPESASSNTSVVSVVQLIDLPPRLVQHRLRKADRSALQSEMTDWLKKWHLANPMERSEMELQWSSNRQFWLVWSMQSIEKFEDRDVQAAAIELISLDLGDSAKPFLERCLANKQLSALALQHWIPMAEDRQLIAWLQTTDDCEEVRRVLQQLASRNSEDATNALAGVASQGSCGRLLHNVESWNPVHWQRALAVVGRGNQQKQFQSAMLLAAIPDSAIDQQLLGTIQRGVQILPATAVLLLRDAGSSANTLAKVERSPTVASAMLSARLQVQRWQQQAKRYQNSISQEVCKQCEQKS